MNAVTSAQSIGASSVGVRPGSPAGAPPAPGQLFDDLFRQLTGGDLGAGETGDGVVFGGDAGDTTWSVAERGESGADAAPEIAADESTTTKGAMTVPVALVLQSLPVPPPADAIGGAMPVETEDAVQAARAPELAGASKRPRVDTTAAVAGGRTASGSIRSADVVTGTGASTGASAGVHADAPAGQTDLDASSFEPELEPELEATAAAAAEPEAQVAVHHPAERRPGRVRTQADSATGEMGRAGEAQRNVVSADTLPTFGVRPVETPVPAPGPGVALDDSAAEIQTAATVLARVPGAPGDLGHALGLPRAFARPTEPSQHRPPEATADAAMVALADAIPDPVAGNQVSSVPEQVAAPLAAALRGQPALSAALRAFQQAGAAAEGQTASPSTTLSSTGAATDSDRAIVPGNAGRLTGFAGAVADALAPALESDRRAFAPPVMFTPSLGGELRVGSDMSLGPRLERADMPVLADDADEPVHAQIVQSLRVQWAGGASEARVRLRPEFLGEVVATIKVDHGTVTATLHADTPEVRRWLEANTQSLREGLVEHGLKLDRVVVLSEPTRGESADERHGRPRGRQPQHPQPRPRRPRQNDATATFDLDM